jgi:uncharacterized membrane protein YbhN (UPF0104 family)
VLRSGAQPDGLRLGRRALLPFIGLSLTALSAIVAWPSLRPTLADAATAARGADPSMLALAAVFFAGSPACSGLLWRRAILSAGGRLAPADACARYGTGSLVNAILPAHAGDFLRTSLLLSALPAGGRKSIVRCFAVLQLARAVALATLAGAGALHNEVAGAAAFGVLVALLLLRRRERFLGLALLALGLKVGAVALVLTAVGVPTPLRASLAVVPALELAGVFPLTPANIGVASAAAGLALHSQGLSFSVALPASIVIHATETVACLAFGSASLLYLLAALPAQRPRAARDWIRGAMIRSRVALPGRTPS